MQMSSRSFGTLLLVLPLTLAGQSLQERAVPLKNWSAPRKIRRSQVQTQRLAPTPKFQLPGGITSDVLVFVPLAPCRLGDTRPGSGYPALGSTPLAALTPRTLSIAGACGVPSGGIAEAYSLEVTVVPPNGTLGGYLLVYPNPAAPIPLVASMTWNPGASYQTNAVITAASADGSVNVVVDFPTDVVVDINGYYAAPTDSGDNTALGSGALSSDVVSGINGSGNTAFGYQAMNANVTGFANTAVGQGALSDTTDGSDNVALGFGALINSQSGYENTALGTLALQLSNGGNSNTAVGYGAGRDITTGGSNIMIGNVGTSSDDYTIRIGDVQTSTYIAGIFGTDVIGGTPVYINSNGQLGSLNEMLDLSPRSAAGDIRDMGDESKGLLRLRPVTYRSNKPGPDGSKPVEYGLVAEEVAKVCPELVVKGKGGQAEAVQYSKLPVLLLNELQKQYRHAEQQDETIKKLEARLAALEAQLSTNVTAQVSVEKPIPAAAGGR
jgi:hypothetical protein